jgi:hypothetical protein
MLGSNGLYASNREQLSVRQGDWSFRDHLSGSSMRSPNLIDLLTPIVGLLSFVMATSKGAIVWNVSVNDPGSTFQAYYEPIESNLSAALNEYSSLLVSNTPSSIQIEIGFSSSVTRSTGYSATSVFVGDFEGTNVFAQGVASEIATGMDPNGPAPDLYLKFQPSYLTSELWFDPTPQLRNTPVPTDKTDAYSVLLHELLHALGFNGWRDGTAGTLPGSPPYESTFDKWETFDGTNLFFTGAAAESLYPGPVPITSGNNFHVGNELPGPGSDLIPDLMNGVVFERGTHYDISPLDRAILSDIGVAVMRPISGDYNHNGVVDAADYVVWRNGLGTMYVQSDYDVWRAHFGQTAAGGAAISPNTAVPEPATLVLMVIAAIGGHQQRRRST